jgi:hypothetical protein
MGRERREEEAAFPLTTTTAIASIPLAQKRDLAICYTYEADSAFLKARLYAAVQVAADAVRDEAGKPRVALGSRAAYLEDDEEEDENGGSGKSGGKGGENAEDDDFFGAIVAKGAAGADKKSAADRLRQKDGNAAGGGGGGGWFGGLLSSWW